MEQRLQAAGIETVVCSATELIPLLSPEEIETGWARWRRLAGDGGLVVVTSATTVELLAAAIAVDVDVACVGPATRDAAQRAGWRTLGLEARDAATLSHALLAATQLPGRPVWLPQSARAARDLQAALEAAGAFVEVTALYSPRPCADLAARLASVTADAVLLYSGSAAEAFVAAAPKSLPEAVCVGETTANAARRQGFTVRAVASVPTDDAVFEAVMGLLAAGPTQPDGDPP
jgi:uroporphyrinogen-III synthase